MRGQYPRPVRGSVTVRVLTVVDPSHCTPTRHRVPAWHQDRSRKRVSRRVGELASERPHESAGGGCALPVDGRTVALVGDVGDECVRAACNVSVTIR
jgi:hypothetical protein